MRSSLRSCLLVAAAVLVMPAAMAAQHGTAHHPAKQASPAPGADATPPDQDVIVAVVNGSIITRRDVESRGRLFALSTGLPITEEVLNRLRPQITRQLIDEKLRMQEIQQRHIVIPTSQIATSINDIEKRNNLPQNALRDRLGKDGVSLTTLIDQIRVQLAWTQVLRQQLGDRARISTREIQQRQEALKTEAGKPEYALSEIFIPVDDPKHSEDALRFAQTVITQLRAGAPFPIVAAQFSQSQTALDGGSLGWVQGDVLDPEVLAVAKAMPIGAISNPIRVAGGYDIVTLSGRREIGKEMVSVLNIRQAFLPFDQVLNPQAPTQQQQQTLVKAQALVKNAHSCADLEAANKAAGEKRPSDPGPVQANRLNPQMAKVLTGLPIGQASQPLVSSDGIDIVMVCARDEKNLADRSTEEIADQLLNDRVEMVSRQLERDLHRRAVIDMRQKS
ncbi:peptidylprolyl isomerase [Rhizosaccharibacter radicis]|uniref:Parvulin-like PPIase n=1 Tax=Rhizosaccharibacter radicis TaxID=2782605 RepID=A0ABT1VYH4_9PROT|nr:peptidylprolyl isomerase [Acetobacteraceae bacterium KSS12]